MIDYNRNYDFVRQKDPNTVWARRKGGGIFAPLVAIAIKDLDYRTRQYLQESGIIKIPASVSPIAVPMNTNDINYKSIPPKSYVAPLPFPDTSIFQNIWKSKQPSPIFKNIWGQLLTIVKKG